MKKDEETLLQAVIIANAFDEDDKREDFNLTAGKSPRSLLKVANRPLINYAVEFLRRSGVVRQVIVYCADGVSAAVKDAVLNEAENDSDFVHVVINDECRSFGDAMRDLDARDVIKSDFVLLGADSVFYATPEEMRRLVRQHAERRKKDPDATMTLLYSESTPKNDSRSLNQELVLAVDAESGRILHHNRLKSASKAQIPLEIFEEEDVDIRFDLLDPSVSICSLAVASLFADNFDSQTLDAFVVGLLENDLTTNTLYMAVVEDGYAAKLCDPRTFIAVNKDVLCRWLYPMTPDRFGGYKHLRHNVYRTPDADVGRNAFLKRNVVLGNRTRIGDFSSFDGCCIGSECIIGKNVLLKDCVIFDNVRIEDGCKVENCVIADDCILEENVFIEGKSVLGRGVVLPKGVCIPLKTRLVSKLENDFDGDDASESTISYGEKAFVFVDDDSDVDDEDEEGDEDVREVKDFWGAQLTQSDDEDSSDESDSDEDGDVKELTLIPDILDNEEAKLAQFHTEVLESLRQADKAGVKPDELSVEINSSRHSYAVVWGDVVNVFAVCRLEIASGREPDLIGAKLLKSILSTWEKFAHVLKLYCKSESTEIDCLYGVEAFAAKEGNDNFLPVAMKAIHGLYDKDVVSEEAVTKWFEDERDAASEKVGEQLRSKVKPFVDWLQQSEDEDSE